MDKKTKNGVSLAEILTRISPQRMHDSDDLLIVDDLKAAEFRQKMLKSGSFMTFCYCKTGSISFRLSRKHYKMVAGDLLVLFGEQYFEGFDDSHDFSCVMMLESRQFVNDCLLGMLHFWPYLLFLIDTPIVHLSDPERERMKRCYQILTTRIKDTEHPYQREAILSLMKVFYLDLCQIMSHHAPKRELPFERGYIVFDRFMQLLSENFRQERNVIWYSRQLQITPKYLSEIIKDISGHTAGYWIQTFVIIEIKKMLTNPAYSIKEIAYVMNFHSQSMLGKYFKNITGISPSNYRQLIGFGQQPQ